MSLINSTAIPSGAAYELEQSLRFNDNGAPYLERTPASAGNRKTWTVSVWLKRGALGQVTEIFEGGAPTAGRGGLLITAADLVGLTDSNGADSEIYTVAKLRDPSAWYHIVAVRDTTQSTSTNRLKIYINGVLQTVTGTYPNQNDQSGWNNNDLDRIGVRTSSTLYGHLDGYLAEFHSIDGQALTPADFGKTGDYGEWKPIEYSGTYGTNGFYLPFKQDYTVEGFSTVVWKGNNANQYIGGTGFSPDLTWIKERNGTRSHVIYDQVRGLYKDIRPNTTAAEGTGESGKDFTAFNSDGFTLGVGYTETTNRSGYNYVAWNWDMGGSNATNTAGSIQSTVRANTTYGQSIVSYTGNGTAGATVGHGLSSVPEMIILKRRSSSQSWFVYHKDFGTLGHWQAKLNTTDAPFDDPGAWNDTAPSNSLITFGNSGATNQSSGTFIAYCFHSVTGYSKFGSYTGNGSTTGPSVTTGFKPAFVMLKKTNASGTMWMMFDSTRSPNNTISEYLDASSSSAEGSYPFIDFNSNGFQLKHSSGHANGNGDTYIYMAFADKREYAYWLDQSGNNNDWTSNNLTESDISVDSPTNNFSTMNPLANANGGTLGNYDSDSFTVSEGNLKTRTAGLADGRILNTIMPATGKWYFEFVVTELAETNRAAVSVGEFDSHLISQEDQAGDHYMLALGAAAQDRLWYYGNEKDDYNYVPAVGDLWQFAFDITGTTHKIWIRQNAGNWFGTSSSTFASGSPAQSQNKTSADTVFYVAHNGLSGSASSASTVVFNFGQDSSFAGTKTAQGNQDSNNIGDFYYTPPTGFLALCTKNLPDVDVVPSENFNTVLWSGSGSSQSITGVGFQPDWLWIKMRSSAYNHRFFDAIRGSANGVYSPNTNVEGDYSAYDGVTSFNTDGFSLSGKDGTDKSGETYVAWNWKANGSGSSNTAGSINSTVSANVNAGFSVVSYTVSGTSAHTTGHGLSKAPELILWKSRDRAASWSVYAKPIGNAKKLVLDTTGAEANTGGWSSTTPSSTLVYHGGYYDGDKIIYYAFHSVDGYSKVGSYKGNGNADGTFVYTGFRPAFLLMKVTNTASDWHIVDSARDVDNVIQNTIDPNTSSAEGSGSNRFDFTSNGFKLRQTSGSYNGNGSTYIYIAFAETPFKYSNAR